MKPTITKYLKIAGAVVTLIAGIAAFIWAVSDRFVTNDSLQLVKREIIGEMRKESAKTRSVYLKDLEARLLSAELEIEKLTEQRKPVPIKLRRKLKELQRFVEELNK